jgi:hypothetical protein
MKNIIRRRESNLVEAITFEGIITIDNETTSAVSCSFDIDENYPYTWENGYECIRTDVELPEAYTVGGEWLLIDDGDSYRWEASPE